MKPALTALQTLWRGRLAPARLLWPWMLGAGSLLNLLASFAALIAAAQDLAPAWVLGLHLAPLPLNLLLYRALWRAPGLQRWQLGLGTLWLLAMLVI